MLFLFTIKLKKMKGKEYLKELGISTKADYYQDTRKGSVKRWLLADLLDNYQSKVNNNSHIQRVSVCSDAKVYGLFDCMIEDIPKAKRQQHIEKMKFLEKHKLITPPDLAEV